jgi:hypothetical protein
MKLAEYPDVLDELLAEVARLRNFDLDMLVPACRETVIRPMLKLARECYVYGVEPGTRVWDCVQDIVQPDRGKHRLRLDREVITGCGQLWSVCGGAGAIVIWTPFDIERLRPIFRQCFGPKLVYNGLSSHSRSSIGLARKLTADGTAVCFVLSATEGIEYLTVIARDDRLQQLFTLAAEECEAHKPESLPITSSRSSPAASPPAP